MQRLLFDGLSGRITVHDTGENWNRRFQEALAMREARVPSCVARGAVVVRAAGLSSRTRFIPRLVALVWFGSDIRFIPFVARNET